jgi:glycerol uptake operon antiterminator
MSSSKIIDVLSKGSAIPVVRSYEDFNFAIANATAPSVMVLFGEVSSLPQLLSQAKLHSKRLILHVDYMDGISKDKAGIKFLARIGVTAMVTTRSHLVKLGREEGMIVIQRLFLVDSESLRVGIQLLRNCKPDIVEIMPAHTPAKIIQELTREVGLPTLAGGFVYNKEAITSALENGVHAVSTSCRDLWQVFRTDLVGLKNA